MNASELKLRVEVNDPDSLFFSRNNMKYAGDTMRNFGVRSTKIYRFYENDIIEVWELYRRMPTSKGLLGSFFFCKETFKQVYGKIVY